MAKTASRVHELDEAVAEVAATAVKKASAGPAAPMALLLGEATKLTKSAKKAAKKTRKRTKKQARKSAKLERKALRTKTGSDRTRPGSGRPPAAPLTKGRRDAGAGAATPDAVEAEASTGTAAATESVDTDTDTDTDAGTESVETETGEQADARLQAQADEEAAARLATSGADTDDTELDDAAEDGSDDVDDEFEALLGRGSFSADRGKATSFLTPGPKAAATTPTEDAGAQAGAAAEAAAEPAAATVEAGTDKTADVGELCRHIATWWRVLTPSAGALTVADLKWLGGRLEPEQWKDLEQVAAAEHKSLVARLAEQNLEVTDDGVLVHDVAGKQEPLPVDDDGNPIAATASAAADPEARAKALVEYRSGKLYRARTAENDGVLVDTGDSFSADGGAGWENVTLDKDGRFYLTSQPPGAEQVTVVNSGDVVMRGQIKVSLGSIGTLSNRADPDPVDGEALRAALTVLQGQGSRLLFKVVEIVENVRTTGREFLADAVEAETVAAASPGTVAALKSVGLWRALADEVGAAELAAIIEKRGWRGTGTEIQDENGEPVDAALARDLLKKELADLEAKKAAAKETTKAGTPTSAAAAP